MEHYNKYSLEGKHQFWLKKGHYSRNHGLPAIILNSSYHWYKDGYLPKNGTAALTKYGDRYRYIKGKSFVVTRYGNK